MKSLQELYAFISSHLKPNGYFILIDMHPHMFYVGKGTFVPLDGRKIYIENYVHNISDHIEYGINMSLDLKCLQESFVPDTWAAKSIDHGDLSEHPLGIGYLWASNSPRKGKWWCIISDISWGAVTQRAVLRILGRVKGYNLQE